MASPLALREEDVKLMLTAKIHIGTKFCDPNMERYVFKRRRDGIYILNLGKTWEKLQLAARTIVAIENRKDVVAISGRTWGQRAVFKYAQYTECAYIAGRFTPGTFTNQIQKKFIEPRLLIITDPVSDHQPIKEASLVNVPTIAFCSSDAPLSHIDIAIPCNNKSKTSIALLYWFLAREVLRLRALQSRSEAWPVSADLFVYRDPEEAEKQAKEAADDVGGDAGDEAAPESKLSEYATTETTTGHADSTSGYTATTTAPETTAVASTWNPRPAPATWNQ